jgi:hypothetical protein
VSRACKLSERAYTTYVNVNPRIEVLNFRVIAASTTLKPALIPIAACAIKCPTPVQNRYDNLARHALHARQTLSTRMAGRSRTKPIRVGRDSRRDRKRDCSLRDGGERRCFRNAVSLDGGAGDHAAAILRAARSPTLVALDRGALATALSGPRLQLVPGTTLLAQPTPSAEDRFLALPPVHRADLEGQQRVELPRSLRGRRMMGWTAPRTASACQDGRCRNPI